MVMAVMPVYPAVFQIVNKIRYFVDKLVFELKDYENLLDETLE